MKGITLIYIKDDQDHDWRKYKMSYFFDPFKMCKISNVVDRRITSAKLSFLVTFDNKDIWCNWIVYVFGINHNDTTLKRS